MKYLYLFEYFILFFLFLYLFFILFTLQTFKESFHPNKQTFILLGDSILNNRAYVSQGKSVNDLLIERTNGKTISLAMDDSKIVDVYKQISNIPDVQNNFTTIFLSVGGNNILSSLTENVSDIHTLFTSYETLVKSIQINQPNATLVLLDIYYPNNAHLKKYHRIIQVWNEMLYKYATKNNYSVLKISNILTQPTDFTQDIEPSVQGSEKIVRSILFAY